MSVSNLDSTKYCAKVTQRRVYMSHVQKDVSSAIELSLDNDLNFLLKEVNLFLRDLEKDAPKMVYEFLPNLRSMFLECITYKEQRMPEIEKRVIVDTIERCCSKSTFYPYIYYGFADVIEKLVRF